MPSTDGEDGIKLEDFLKMWSEDGTQLIEQDKRQINGFIWLLYSIYFPESAQDYGRHVAMLLKVDSQTNIILLHDIENLQGTVIGGGHRSIEEWFEQHAGKYYKEDIGISKGAPRKPSYTNTTTSATWNIPVPPLIAMRETGWRIYSY